MPKKGTTASKNRIEKVLNNLKKEVFYEGQILHVEKMDKKPPTFGQLNHNLHNKINSWLNFNDYSLYSHQTKAIDAILDEQNTILVTSTASGKSMAYNIPVLESLLKEKNSTFLYLFPQKALSQDQLNKLKNIFDFLQIDQRNIGIYDGDTNKDEKARIRREARVVLTNPYGLHYYLPFKELWRRFFSNLKYIIIDECHQYRGIFGSNFAQVIRRLLRILRPLGAHPKFILCSATIGNPSELAQKLTSEENFTIVDENGAPNSGRYLVLWNLPMYEGSDRYKSPHSQTRQIFDYILEHDLQTLTFTNSRKMAELNAYFSKNHFKGKKDNFTADRIISYRAGLNPSDRRKIEKGLRNRDLLGVYATNALELGVDIGSLECTILSGFPGTISSMWQQIGRAGRHYDPNKGIESLSVVIPFQDPLHLYYIRHHEELLNKNPEICNINLENPHILQNHLKCAAKESPIISRDAPLFGDGFQENIDALEEKGVVKRRGTRYFYNSADKFPPKSVNLSGISDNDFKVLIKKQDGSVITTYEEKGYVFKELHLGAVYLYMAEPYIVEDIDLNRKIVRLIPDDGQTYTNARILTDIEQIGSPDKSKVENGLNVYYGDVKVTENVIGYDIKSTTTGENLAYEQLEMPPVDLNTKAVWFSIPPELIETLESKKFDFDGSIHAIEHAAIAMAPYFTMCDRWDIGGVSTRQGGEQISKWPVIYIYDGFPGGIGIAEALYELIIDLLEKTLELIESCKCKEQCPGCVMSPKCGNQNNPLDKYGAIDLLKILLKK